MSRHLFFQPNKKAKGNTGGKSNPKPGEVVRALSKKSNVTINEEVYPDKREVWICPFGRNCKLKEKPVEERMWRVPKSGFSNLYSHMITCSERDESGLLQMYADAVDRGKIAGVDASEDGYLKQHLEISNVSEKAKQLHGWMKWITKKNMPLTAIQDKDHREIVKYNMEFSYPTLVKVMRKVVELVEKKIKDELQEVKAAGGKAAIIYDGWTSQQNEHYVGLYISYQRPVHGRTDNRPTIFWVKEMVLLACSPMNEIQGADDASDDEIGVETAINFGSEQHVEFIEYTLCEYYGISIEPGGFITNQITDNASVNLRIGRILNIPTVGCMNHRLNLEMEYFVQNNCAVMISSVRDTMVSIASSIKLVAHLQRHTQLKTIFYNDTRWYGKFFMLKRWLELRPHVIEVNREILRADRNGKCIVINTTGQFRDQVEKHCGYFEKLHKTHVKMEVRGATLSKCWEQFEAWQDMMAAPLPETHTLHGCNLEMKYMSYDSQIIKYLDFERGVVKIQRGETSDLTADEKIAVSSLRKISAENIGRNDAEEHDLDPTMVDSPTGLAAVREQRRHKQQAVSSENEYISCDYILGSVAEVERLWSLVRNVLTDHRMGMKPVHLESLMFLKVNMRFWDDEMVQEALDECKNDE